jgi:murein L,D-transpeptidase YcbB/YkuD
VKVNSFWHTKQSALDLTWVIHVFGLVLPFFLLPFSAAHPSQDESSIPILVFADKQDIQQMSREGQTELRSILSAGELPELRWPRFEDLQVEIDEFYSSVGYSFAWVRSSKATAQAKVMIELLKTADRKGLEPEDYDGPRWRARIASLDHGNASSESDLLHFDVALTVSAMRYISDLHRGRLNPRSVHIALDVENSELDLSEFLRLKIVSASDVEATLADAEPPFPTYHRTIRALQSYLVLANSGDGAPLPMPPRAVNPGEKYSGMLKLTRLLMLYGDLPKRNTTRTPADLYDRSLVAGVKKFQERHGLQPDGRIDSETVKAFNVPLKHRVTQLQLTLERFRWMPRRFSRPPIVVNIPEFRLRAVDENYHWALSMKIVVGKAYGHQTPVFTSELRSVTFRPSWNVPLRIQQHELLPQIEKNPSYLSENSYVVTDSSGTVVEANPASSEVWENLRSGELRLRQEPGPDNSLGLIRFDLSDPFDIYLHGTPTTELFSMSRRDFSHGCIRVEDPIALAAWVLRDDPQWTSDSIRAAIFDDETIRVSLQSPIPVLIVYGTAVVMESGEVHFFDDIYEQDAVLERALAVRYLDPQQ